MRAVIVDDYPVVAASDLAPYVRSHQALHGSRFGAKAHGCGAPSFGAQDTPAVTR
jgi:hypothetical protein